MGEGRDREREMRRWRGAKGETKVWLQSELLVDGWIDHRRIDPAAIITIPGLS